MKNLNHKYIRLTSENRLYGLKVPIIGLTGGIATGKSTVSNILKNSGLPVIDADQLVKVIYSREETRELIRKNHPEAWVDDVISFPELRKKFFAHPHVRQEIEKYIYQRLPAAWVEAYETLRSPTFVVYDVPLLFEKKLEDKVDLKVLVYAPRTIQEERLRKRDGHNEEMINSILDHQINIEDKKSKVDFVINNSGELKDLDGEVQNFLRQVLI